MIPTRCSQRFPNAAAEQRWNPSPCLAPAVSGKASQELLLILKPDESTSVELKLLVLSMGMDEPGGGYIGGVCRKKGEDSSVAVDACNGMQRAGLPCRVLHTLHCSTCEMLHTAARLPCCFHERCLQALQQGMGSRYGPLCCTHAGEQLMLLGEKCRTAACISTLALVFTELLSS